jgi:hypothetical protein
MGLEKLRCDIPYGTTQSYFHTMSCRDQAFSSSLCSKGFDINEEINNIMNGIPKDEYNGYMFNNFDDATSDGTLRRTYSNSMSDITNEEGNGEEEEEQGDIENGRRNSRIPSKCKFT